LTPVALTIAGSDPSGGAGLQADLKTFHQHRVYGAAVVSLITVQNSRGVQSVQPLEGKSVGAQLDAVLDDLPVHAVKTGALGDAEIVEAVARRLRECSAPLVIDPVLCSTSGQTLLDERARELLVRELLPVAFLVTPNLDEAALLAGHAVVDPASMEGAAARIADHGVPHVLIKGGHLDGRPIDVLWSEGRIRHIEGERVDTPHGHGTGCVLSAAVTAGLALGVEVEEAVQRAVAFVRRGLRGAPGLGQGRGPLDLFATP